MGGVLAPFVVQLQSASPILPFLVFLIPAALASACTLLLPETRGKPLPQTLADVVPTLAGLPS